MFHFRLALLLIGLLSAVGIASAQVATGTPPFGSFGGGALDTINLSNLNINIEITTVNKSGRGMNFSHPLAYDSSVWYPSGTSGSQVWLPITNFGWTGNTSVQAGYNTANVTSNTQFCNVGGGHQLRGTWYYDSNFVHHDHRGTKHPFSGNAVGPPSFCGPFQGFTNTTTDGSGQAISVLSQISAPVIVRQGSRLAPTAYNSFSGSDTTTDANGNEITTNLSGVVTDTLGMTALTIAGSGTPASPITLTYPTATGANAVYTVKYAAYTVKTNFGCTGVGEYGPTSVNLVSEIDNPDGTKYIFSYEPTPGFSGDVTGRLAAITEPTGGTVNYTYTGANNGVECSDGSAAGLTRQTPDGTWAYTRALGTGAATTTTITDPQSNQSVLNFQGIYETEGQAYQGSTSGTLQQTTTICYNGNTTGCNSAAISLPITQRNVYVQWPGTSGLESETATTYNSNGLVTELDEYAYGAGSPGSLVRKTLTTYAALANGIASQPASVTVETGAGATVSQTLYTYDSAVLTSVTGVAQHDDTNYGISNTARGNLTKIQKWVAGSNFLTATATYDTTGQMLQSTDFAGNPTSYNYSDNLYTDNGSNPPQSYTPSQPTNAYLHTVTVPIIGLDETYGYFVASGDSAFSIDQNGGDSYAHFDSLGRVSTKYLPPSIGGTRGWTMFQYPTANELDSFISISSGTPSTSCTSCVHGQTLFDSQGRDASEVLVSDPDGATTTATSYDSLGRVHNSTNPYRSTSDPTYGTETFSYDSLNRTTSVVLADGSIANAFYGAGVGAAGGNTTQLCSSGTYGLGYPAMKVDPSGRKVQRWSDALGRVIEVDEQDATGSLTVGTCNVYDALGNLTQIVQGTQTRSFAYDGLSRLTTSATPEAGTKTDYFTTAAGGLCAGNPALMCRTTDARGITSTSTYDGLNRVTSVSYSDGTPTVNYFYDQSSYNGLTITNGKGRLTGMSDGAGQSAYSYDLLGRVVAEIHTVAGNSKTTTYTYNLDGSMSSITYPSGRHLTYTYSNAQRPLSVVDSTSGVSYASAAVYAPQGAISTVKFGVAGSFLGITESNSYNHRLQVASQQASSSTGSALSLSYGYPAAPGNSGHVSSIANLLDAGRTENVVNDQLNRISTATSQATSGPDCWGQSFGYDRWANLLSVSVTQCSGSALGVSVTNNRITTAGYVYDASGDMTSDGSNSYTYDAEQRLTSAAGVTYTYDGRGLRVKKSNGTIYWRGYFSDASSESDLSGNISNEYVFFGGVRIARIDSLANVYYYFADRLGSTRAITTSNGTVCYSADFTPFGGETASVNSCPQNYRFANLERDLETGLDYAVYRHYSPRLGRFMQPDVLGGSISNPQSLNRYAYALDDPCDLTDPLGLSPCTLNIALKNTVGMSDAVIQDVEKQINALLGPSVTANFVNSTGDADASLVIESGFPNNPSMLGGNWGGAFDNFVYENNIIRSFPNAPIGTLINITGTVGAAELYHGVTGLKDVPTSAKFPNDIMSMDNMPRQTAKQKLSANTLQFTPDEKKALLNACLKDRNQSTDNPQLPDDTDEFEALQIPSDPDGTVTTKETDNLPAPCTNGQYSGCTVIGSPSGFSSGDGDGSDVGDGGGGGEPIMGFDDPAPDDEDFDE